ncbi:PIG-L family deacetylase [Allobranchiibius sp. CTAmp26]|uniref:PIG-L family deacetylase n=1 Tax=Allobranchiibius sp. CTAmp26 TaxID=2815214 RepID=UPI001AA17DF9|nr:PIG-L family deacetylase [Allobranchiibius sp. CTAmp26]MBO1754200.1 PIG-L family deacetylase [Allobranchiibius sp. CTAmp26]
MSHTLVVFHAHPDDEALLTSGTMAKAAAEGHRVVLVVATDGDLGLAASSYRADGRQLGGVRMRELLESARALGVARTVHLGYADSGSGPLLYDDPPGATRFARADLEEAAGRLADILREEHADVLLTYDAAGGYGHRDHVQVHHVGARAAEIADTARVLQATVPRDLLVLGIRLVSRLHRFPADFDIASYERAYSPRAAITHRIRVHRQIAAKRASMRAHASQATADDGDRTLGLFLRIPRPLYDLIFGWEWYVDPARPDGHRPVSHDLFDGLPR